MSYTVRWRKAIALSVFLHIFLGAAVGYMTVRLTPPPPPDEQVIELDMAAALPDAGPAETEPEVALPSTPLPEVLPPEELPPVEPPPAITEDIVDSEPVPIKEIPAEKDIPAPVSSSKRSAMGTPPIVLVRANPINPPELDEVGRKVVVVLRMQILENGSPGKISVAVPSGYKSINDAAIAAAKKWHFEPAKDREGRPMVCSTILSIPFIP
ncbi:energy transducer TonB [Pelosinus sp. UFO1]|uniref:energy transducer TonB n=1 Tax=Pelosinus sp. UFO1 TaxID=484770 RepID=UPI0004D140B4|nr:energy transducer TonB [Pelosinus sp. UFO1]AIF49809.1 TonB family protein [Pelosinus sp. UFO1]